MANTKSAEKRARQSETRRLRNRKVKSIVRKGEKDFHTAVAAGSKEDAAKALREAISRYDKAAKRGVVKKGTADRKKSRLSAQLNKLNKPA
jgi:small subunit ribosomal protein S20